MNLYNKYKGRVQFVVIDMDHKQSPAQQELVKRYYTDYIPHVVVLDRSGNTIYNSAGEAEESRIEAHLDKALKEDTFSSQRWVFAGTIPRQSDRGELFIPHSGEALVAAKSPTPQRTLTIERVVSSDGTPILVCHGHIVIETADRFKSEVKSLAPQHKCIQADMSNVPYVDSSGLGTILGAYMSAKSAGCELKLIRVHPNVRDLLNITRLASVFEAQGQ